MIPNRWSVCKIPPPRGRGIQRGCPAAAVQVGSTILAQAAGVPTLPWSGSGVAVDYASCNGIIPVRPVSIPRDSLASECRCPAPEFLAGRLPNQTLWRPATPTRFSSRPATTPSRRPRCPTQDAAIRYAHGRLTSRRRMCTKRRACTVWRRRWRRAPASATPSC